MAIVALILSIITLVGIYLHKKVLENMEIRLEELEKKPEPPVNRYD